MTKQDELDAVLDAALDELDEEEDPIRPANSPLHEADSKTVIPADGKKEGRARPDDAASEVAKSPAHEKKGGKVFFGPPRPPPVPAAFHKDRTEGGHGSKSPGKPKLRGKGNGMSGVAGNDAVDEAIASLVEDLALQPPADDNGAAINGDTTQEELMRNLSNIIDSVGEIGAADFSPEKLDDDNNIDPDSVLEGMMEQLLSKDLMYEPIKQVASKFPVWLKEKKSALSEKDYQDRSKQCECFQKLVLTYENEPDNTEKLMLLMEEVQEFGQPPTEIIQVIAPGLEMDEDGMPKFDPTNEQCRIM